MSEFDATMKLPSDDAESSGAASEGEHDAPAGLSAEPEVAVKREWVEPQDDEVPPDDAEPLLPSVNPKIGPETASARAARYREMADEGRAVIETMVEENPDSALAKFWRYEVDRDRRMEAVRAAFLAAQKKQK